MADPLTFPAQVVKVQTLADSGLRLTLDLPETEIVAFAWLAQCKRDGVALDVTCQPREVAHKPIAVSVSAEPFDNVQEFAG